MRRTGPIAFSLLLAALAISCGDEARTTNPTLTDGISIGVIAPPRGTLLQNGQALDISATVSYTLASVSSANAYMIIQDQKDLLRGSQPVAVSAGTGTASFAESLTVPASAQKVVVYFALFADGKTSTRSVDSVEYIVLN